MSKILFIGDIVGHGGREAAKKLIPALRQELSIDFCVANGENMAGGNETFLTDCALNSTSLFGLAFTSCGQCDGTPTIIKTEGGYKAFYTQDDRLTGYMLVGDTKRAGIYTRLISTKTPLSEVESDLFIDPALRIFDEKTRKKYLAKEV